ncbi:MAG: cytochrome c [Methylococcales bacterium]|nr:cytochrome c [Methylococcales bacterium]
MPNKNNKIIFALLIWLSAGVANAADSIAGQTRSEVCQGCHGVQGNNRNQGVPNLGGQSAIYLEAQLNNYKGGVRENPVMKSMTATLGDPDIQDISAYFASQPASTAGGDAKLAEKGKAKATMCMGCHGGNFLGLGGRPRLAGQHPEYLDKQLHDFKTGARSGPAMNAVAKTLSDEDIREIAAYLGSLGQ